jgi:thiamine pyrophosphate-dependent acetolactate synthase large subunit-like protein
VDAGELNMSYRHPLYQGQTGHMFGFASLPTTSKGDVNLICGTYMLPEVFPHLGDVFADTAKVIHIDLNAHEIAKNHRVDMGVVSDPKLTLSLLASRLGSLMSDAQKSAARSRRDSLGAAKKAKLEREIAADAAAPEGPSLRTAQFMRELARTLPEDALIFDEALTGSPDLTRYLTPTKPDSFFQTRGGSLGVGIPGAIALKIAHPDRQVIGFTGDGGSMYTIQALWTAAHHRIGAKFVILNNQSYMLLELNILQYWKERGVEQHAFPGSFILDDPGIDFARLSEAMGVPAVQVERRDQIAPAIKRMLETDGPFLVDLVVSSSVPGSNRK